MKNALLTVLLAALLLLSACGSSAPGVSEPPGAPTSGDPVATTPDTPPDDVREHIFNGKIVQRSENSVLLVRTDGVDAGLYSAVIEDAEIVDESGGALTPDSLRAGMLVEITYSGWILEMFPGQLSGITELLVTGREDDLVSLYLTVIRDLFNVDPGLNSDIDMIALDLSAIENLSAAEKNALIWLTGSQHGVEALAATFEELQEQGLITGEMPYMEFERGIAISFTDMYFSEGSFTFAASKWRSPLGAYFFGDCTATRAPDRTYTYEIGSEAIA